MNFLGSVVSLAVDRSRKDLSLIGPHIEVTCGSEFASNQYKRCAILMGNKKNDKKVNLLTALMMGPGGAPVTLSFI